MVWVGWLYGKVSLSEDRWLLEDWWLVGLVVVAKLGLLGMLVMGY